MLYKSLNIYDPNSRSFINADMHIDVSGDDKNCSGLYAIPGFVDVHTHGGIKYSFEKGTVDDIIDMFRFYAEYGTLYIMPTIGTIPLNDIYTAAERILAAVRKCENSGEAVATVMGIHYECRYLNPVKAGAHSPELLVAPSTDEADRLIDLVYGVGAELGRKLHVHFTIAPELEGGTEFIEHVTSRGATVGIGHSDADYLAAEKAVNAGAVSFTHLFNALRPIHHRNSSAVTYALTNDVYTEFICDGLHLLPEIAKLIKTAKDENKVVLVSDSVAAGVKEGDGFVFFSGHDVHIENGIALMKNGTICGSAIVMSKAAQNYMKFTGATLDATLKASIANPLSMLNLNGVYGNVDNKNFLIVDKDLNIVEIFANNNRIITPEAK